MSGPVIEAPAGRIRGLAQGRGAAFLGIPYALPPVGAGRFRAPEPLASAGQIDATRPGLSPPQPQRPRPAWAALRPAFETGEDCLNLNIFTPAAATSAALPVIVHVFGGGFEGGSANAFHGDGAAFAARHGVVLVRVNFRVGALGFLDLSRVLPGAGFAANAGLLDLKAALGWIAANIAAFGGDPGNVTLAGLSSGAFMSAALFGVPGAAALFRRAWLMSGSASRIVAPETADAMAGDFLARLGGAPDLAAAPLDRILSAQGEIVSTDLGARNAPGGRTLGTVLDGQVLARAPLDALRGGAGRGHELVLGWTRDEARLWFQLGAMQPAPDAASLGARLARFGAEAAEGSDLDAGPGLQAIEERFLSDRIYRRPALATAAAQTAAGGRAWAYQFGWTPEGALQELGASHGMDEAFVFGDVDPSRVPYAAGSASAPDRAGEMSAALIAFARGEGPGWPAVKDAEGPVRHFA